MAYFGNEDDIESKQQLAIEQDSLTSEQVTHVTVPSGIPGLDAVLGEGLIEGNVYLLLSDSGEYSKQIIHQILYNRIISKSPVTYYTFEDSSGDIIEEMAHHNMYIQKFVNEGSWKFTRIVTSELKHIIDVLPDHPMDDKVIIEGKVDDLSNHFIEQIRNDRNTVMQFTHIIRELTPVQIQQLMLYLKGSARKFGGIHFIVLNKGGENKEKEFVLKDLADTIFDISTTIKGKNIEITAVIEKARMMRVDSRKLNLVDKNGVLSSSTIQRI